MAGASLSNETPALPPTAHRLIARGFREIAGRANEVALALVVGLCNNCAVRPHGSAEIGVTFKCRNLDLEAVRQRARDRGLLFPERAFLRSRSV